MSQTIEQLLRGYTFFEVLIEMTVIWICVYLVARFLRGTRGVGVVKGVAVMLIVVTLIIRVLGETSEAFSRLQFIYNRFLALLAVLLIVVFQPELRQAMIRLGRARFFGGSKTRYAPVVEAVGDAVDYLSKSQFGALIAIERDTKLGAIIGSGEPLDAQVGARLLQSIFWPNSPLHDLGVIIREDRIVAANVQFPLAEDGDLPANLGSRHRAALGLTHEADCLVVVVSEETGTISIAEHGRLSRGIDREQFKQLLSERLAVEPTEEPKPVDNPVEEAGKSEPTSESAETNAPEPDAPATPSTAGGNAGGAS